LRIGVEIEQGYLKTQMIIAVVVVDVVVVVVVGGIPLN
jgi:hypothetical protein